MRGYLKTLRNEKNITQKQIGEKLGMSESTYNQIENFNRQKELKMCTLVGLSKALDVPIERLIEEETVLHEQQEHREAG
jgi:transcriptional regulator with XRE-family HTH domain